MCSRDKVYGRLSALFVQMNEMGEIFGSYGERCQCDNTTSGACPKGLNGDICSGMCYFVSSYIHTLCSLHTYH